MLILTCRILNSSQFNEDLEDQNHTNYSLPIIFM